ncbi:MULTISPECIES: phage head closure protein [Thermoanaerobacterium]|uniref:Phage head-tail adaptor n=2 Tax=Thermoanaerobacterium TaxID=28895 RepID=W9E9N3_9THEO|nr:MULTISPECIES: phage head closure protein [Thermoanaerobacterium]AFK87420.1 phage head-tail adaptor [Thermoanaerobacterium saccharolyticum JW/SL-YS485]ETO37791.1 phage head-tail adaptor [Thermoanaerobacterium aotearoense SCUT27]
MLFRDTVDLLEVEETINSNGFPETSIVNRRTVYANRKSVRQAEFYNAAMQNINLAYIFEIRTGDYNGEKYLEYNGTQYYIVRTYDKNGEIIELSCADKDIKAGVKNS